MQIDRNIPEILHTENEALNKVNKKQHKLLLKKCVNRKILY